uniref:Protein kinase domain-containing protein n=1 Tax=Periophthalmus magnuspinnatus TaxID=409849 RepID=A0A3B4A8D9_9GOBI
DTDNQVIRSNSPESCLSYLMELEKKGDPHVDHSHLTRLLDFYTRVFSNLPLGKHSQNESYAKMLVRFAELKIQDVNEAEANFKLARSHSQSFAFVHIAYAKFEVSQNTKRAVYILQSAIEVGAKPKELLEDELQKIQCGKLQQSDLEDKENLPIDQIVNKQSPETCWTHLKNLEKRGNPQMDSNFLIKLKDCYSKIFAKMPIRQYSKNPSYAKMLVRYAELTITDPDDAQDHFIVARSNCKAFAFVHIAYAQFEVTQNVMKASSILHKAQMLNARPIELLDLAIRNLKDGQSSIPTISNDSITIKGKQFFILKIIGRGGSSKVYQVLDHKKQLFAVKYVDLEEADPQTVESYKNEIEHLNHLQQYSDQIIKLYDEITNSYIYMLMECGNLDLNTWLRNRKSVNPLERKFYWKNMLEAVHTIHKHIVHSDLKPANFVIVNASLKLIDFGIANKIQPDVTSIMKDSQQVGTLNYMPPEAIKDTSSQGKARSKQISPKGDVWSLGCILYCMTYGKTPFQSITNQIAKLHAIIDPTHKIDFPDISERDLLDVLKRCLVRKPKERISIAELLEHPYLQLKPQASPEQDLQKILTDLAALQSPNSIVRAANNLARMCSSGRKLDVAECAKSST